MPASLSFRSHQPNSRLVVCGWIKEGSRQQYSWRAVCSRIKEWATRLVHDTLWNTLQKKGKGVSKVCRVAAHPTRDYAARLGVAQGDQK